MNFDHEQKVGVLGGGQLGRMLAIDARRMGFQVTQWTGGELSGAGRLSDTLINAPFDDSDALEHFIQHSDVATIEFENVPKGILETLESRLPVHPRPEALYICQHREREKLFLREQSIPTAAFHVVNTAEELQEALEAMPYDVIIKTCQFGYDGKGQMEIPLHSDRSNSEKIWAPFKGGSAIIEEKINLKAELSVMVARTQSGEVAVYDPAENEHKDHILHLSIVPARLPQEVLTQAQQIAIKITECLKYVGIMGVEFFLDSENRLLVNEMACRPHNSGHHTIDACETSQFEQQLRAISGLPLGGTELLRPVVMWNILGDLWINATTPPNWNPVYNTPGATLHLYGKQEAKKKRKMGHVTFTAPTQELALLRAEKCLAQMS